VRARDVLEPIVRWYAATAYGRWEGPDVLPYYCDPARVGRFAVAPAALAAGDEAALFQILVTMAMYQSRRDVDIMAIQRRMPARAAEALTSARRLRVLADDGRCDLPRDLARFDDECDVRRDFERGDATCGYRPRTTCHVKLASVAIGRMGDLGKLPASAWLHVSHAGGLTSLFERATNAATPAAAADQLVDDLSRIYRIGVKLATMYVSALTTPDLAPGLTPWSPRVDGNHLVVVDANVGRVIDALRTRGPKTYAAKAAWFRRAAAKIDLRKIRPDWPRSSPRLVQQAVYVYRSRSNRLAAGDTCDGRCDVPSVCPFHASV
jgi:hypothetical protein